MVEAVGNFLKKIGVAKTHNPLIKSPLAAQEEANTILEGVGKVSPEGYDTDRKAKKELNKYRHNYVITAQAEKTVRAEEQAFKDSLTDVASRRALDDYLLNLLRHPRPGSADLIFMLDVDNFKQYNDNFNHTVGDVVLRQIAEELKEHVRGTDFIGRYGGDEFVIVLPEMIDYTGGWETRAIYRAQKIQKAIEANLANRVNSKAHIHLTSPITSSIGVIAVGPAGKNKNAALEDVQHDIYDDLSDRLKAAKRKGKNRIDSPWDN